MAELVLSSTTAPASFSSSSSKKKKVGNLIPTSFIQKAREVPESVTIQYGFSGLIPDSLNKVAVFDTRLVPSLDETVLEYVTRIFYRLNVDQDVFFIGRCFVGASGSLPPLPKEYWPLVNALDYFYEKDRECTMNVIVSVASDESMKLSNALVGEQMEAKKKLGPVSLGHADFNPGLSENDHIACEGLVVGYGDKGKEFYIPVAVLENDTGVKSVTPDEQQEWKKRRLFLAPLGKPVDIREFKETVDVEVCDSISFTSTPAPRQEKEEGEGEQENKFTTYEDFEVRPEDGEELFENAYYLIGVVKDEDGNVTHVMNAGCYDKPFQVDYVVEKRLIPNDYSPYISFECSRFQPLAPGTLCEDLFSLP